MPTDGSLASLNNSGLRCCDCRTFSFSNAVCCLRPPVSRADERDHFATIGKGWNQHNACRHLLPNRHRDGCVLGREEGSVGRQDFRARIQEHLLARSADSEGKETPHLDPCHNLMFRRTPGNRSDQYGPSNTFERRGGVHFGVLPFCGWNSSRLCSLHERVGIERGGKDRTYNNIREAHSRGHHRC